MCCIIFKKKAQGDPWPAPSEILFPVFRPKNAGPGKSTQVPLHQGQRRSRPRSKKRTDRKNGLFLGPFGRKTGGPLQKKDTFFRVFPIFRDFSPRKRLKLRMFRRFDPTQKNRAEKPTIGFWVFAGYGNMAA
jgi:hypothetical protein